MARIIRNDCVSCPQGCIHCGRDRDYIEYECDACGTTDGPIFEYEPYHYCAPCLLRAKMNEFTKDMIDEHGVEWVTDNFAEVGDG